MSVRNPHTRWWWCLLAVGGLATATWLLGPSLWRPGPVPGALRSELTWRQGRWYWHDGSQLFTGALLGRYPSGAPLSRSMIFKGLLDGLSQSWYTNGQLQAQEHFRHGVSEGRRQKWYPDGRALSEANIVAGKLEGVFRRWYDNGQLAEQIPVKAGQPDGLGLAYYPSGFLKAQTRVQGGKVLARQTWNDGERREVSRAPAAPPAAAPARASVTPARGGGA